MKKIDLLILAGAIILVVLGFMGGYKVARAGYPEIKERTDTLVVRDSLPYYYPVPRDSAVIRYVDVPVTVTVNDTNVITLTANVNVPIERKVYEEDSTYYAVVTGPAVGDLHPSLDTLKVYRETVTIETTKKVTEYKPYKWTIGPFVSQEVGLNDFYLAKAGIAGDFQIKGRFRFQPEIGHYWFDINKHDWYAGAKFKFDLFRGRQ